MSKLLSIRNKRRTRRRHHVRRYIKGSATCPRLTIQKSLQHVYAQLVDDINGQSLGQVNSVNFSFTTTAGAKLTKREKCKQIGLAIALLAKQKGVERVVFDRNYNLYHGRIKAAADGAREGGLKF